MTRRQKRVFPEEWWMVEQILKDGNVDDLSWAEKKSLGLMILRRHGAEKAMASFSGGNDEGAVNHIELVMRDGSELELNYVRPGWDEVGYKCYFWSTEQEQEWYDKQDAKRDTANGGLDVGAKESNFIFDVLASPVYEQWGGFAGEFYVSGTLTWDVARGTVSEISDYEEMEHHSFSKEY